jgi:hypothetical protein
MSTATAPQAMHLHWSRWFHCETSFSLSLVPNKPGIFAIAERTGAHCETSCADGAARRPDDAGNLALNIVQVSAAADLFHALNRLYSQDCPLREWLEKNSCFIRYSAIDDAQLRDTVVVDLQQWLDSPGETDSPFVKDFQRAAGPAESPYRTKGD